MFRLFCWITMGLTIAALALWVISTHGTSQNPLLIVLVIAVFGIAPIGAFWMMYVAIRYEDRPFPIIMMAFVPYSFLWYYFEFVKPGKLKNRRA